MVDNYLVTGGAGFIGSNYVSHLLETGKNVTIFDNLSRAGAEANLSWLKETYGEDSFHLVVGDIRNADLITQVASHADVIVHLAGQVAVTTSVLNPRDDFECNALGTFNVLEAARNSKRTPILLYASTNKVYGGMEDVPILEEATSYRYAEMPWGVSENFPLDFHSPYGCSKGTGDQYVRDYHRIYGLPTVVFRQSCIYGPRQFGVEDQGWLAWFAIAAVNHEPITIYGDGKQVRDVLHVWDLLDVYDKAVDQINAVAGEAFNIGGGPPNTLSIWYEFGPMLEKMLGQEIPVSWGAWRPGDQQVYVSDIRKATAHLDWEPKIGVEEGLQQMVNWVQENRELFT
jgi:CDP-paratose 2-epimerase